jgi:hypothetical protein
LVRADSDLHEAADVRFVPKADILRCGKNSLFDHLIGEQLHLIGDGQPERSGSSQIDNEFKFGGLLDRQIVGVLTSENSPCVEASRACFVMHNKTG